MPTLTTRQIAGHVNGRLLGDGDLTITGADYLDRAGPADLSFIGDGRWVKLWETSQAKAALVQSNLSLEPGEGRALIQVANTDLAMAKVLDLLAPPAAKPTTGVHPTAVVDPSATLGDEVSIGAHCVIGANVRLGRGCVLHPNVVIMHDVTLGADCLLYPGVVIRERCTVGDRCILHAHVSVGNDGFGYRPSEDGRGIVKITHIGTVILGNDVELGASSCVDRGKFAATTIGDGTKIDNQCQIAHNCRVGRMCLISGQVGLAGNVTVGDGVLMGGKAGSKDHITIGAGARIAGYSGVMDDIPPGESWGGMPAQDIRIAMRQHLAMRKLPDVLKKMSRGK